tara:strand:- start:24706 stop:25887 length:1182 start_codon:yes stop_codon:yes gene_type:complete
MTDIKFLVGKKLILDQILEPFDNLVCDFLDQFSKDLNKFNDLKNFTDLKALSFWCRKKNILRMKKNLNFEKNRLGVGFIFHITPSNVPTNFIYSLIFGLISGNSNLVKVPTKNFEQIQIICKILNRILKKGKFKTISNMISIIRYSKEENYTKEISSKCNARLIWGGDKTINDIRQYPLSPRAFDVTFSDRYSICFLNSSEINQASEFELNNLARNFYNDTYLVDQNACSSPHIIFWQGKNILNAKDRFWKHILSEVENKFDLTDSASVDKYSNLCKSILSLDNILDVKNFKNYIHTIDIKNINQNLYELRGKWGLFYQYNLEDINILKKIINSKFQTLTYYGFKKEYFLNFITNNKVLGIDRIVPVGRALDMDINWDGYNICNLLTRTIGLK